MTRRKDHYITVGSLRAPVRPHRRHRKAFYYPCGSRHLPSALACAGQRPPKLPASAGKRQLRERPLDGDNLGAQPPQRLLCTFWRVRGVVERLDGECFWASTIPLAQLRVEDAALLRAPSGRSPAAPPTSASCGERWHDQGMTATGSKPVRLVRGWHAFGRTRLTPFEKLR
jgi:hypothetical protein